MGRKCTICTHPDRELIDGQLILEKPNRQIAARFKVSETSLRRHKKEHLVKAGQVKSTTEETARGLEQIKGLHEQALHILDRGEKSQSLEEARHAIREAKGVLNRDKYQGVEDDEPKATTNGSHRRELEEGTQTELEKHFTRKIPRKIPPVSTEKDIIREVWDFYDEHLSKCGVKLNRRLNDARRELIQGALKRKHTPGELKKAIENTWYPGSYGLKNEYFDLIYAIAQRKGKDNVEEGLARQGVESLSWDNVGLRKKGPKFSSEKAVFPSRKKKRIP